MGSGGEKFDELMESEKREKGDADENGDGDAHDELVLKAGRSGGGWRITELQYPDGPVVHRYDDDVFRFHQGLVDGFTEDLEAPAISEQAVLALPFIRFQPGGIGFGRIHWWGIVDCEKAGAPLD